MGTVNSTDTRRISFDNKLSLTNTLVVPKSIEDDNVIDINTIAAAITATEAENNDDLIFKESNKSLELQKEDLVPDYWANRIDGLKKEHRVINKIIETEYEKTLEKSSDILINAAVTPVTLDKVTPCYECRARILQCYEENPRQPLICAPIIQEFRERVFECRMQD